MVTDPIADLLTRIINAVSARQKRTVIPHSKMKEALVVVLKNHRYLSDYKVTKQGRFPEIEIHFDADHKPSGVKRVSKPGQRVYIKHADIRPVLNGYGISVLSTPKGLMTGREAKEKGLGGEVLCQIW